MKGNLPRGPARKSKRWNRLFWVYYKTVNPFFVQMEELVYGHEIPRLRRYRDKKVYYVKVTPTNYKEKKKR